MPRVLITPFVLQNVGGPFCDTLDSAGFEVVYPSPDAELMQTAGLLEGLDGIDAVIAGMEPFTEGVLSDSQLRVIARMGVGYDAIDVPAASRLGVAIVITAGANDEAVAEQARRAVADAMSPAHLTDSLAVVANFEMMTRVADCTGARHNPERVAQLGDTIDTLGIAGFASAR